MKLSAHILLAGCLLFSSITATAATNLMDVFYLAVDNDPSLKTAKAELEAVKEEYPQAFAGWLPYISVDGRYGRVSQQLEGGSLVLPEEYGNYVYDDVWYALNVTQPLVNIPAKHQIKIANKRAAKAQLEYRLAQQVLLLRAARGYFTVAAAVNDLNLARSEKQTIEALLENTEKRYKAGTSAISDVYHTQARLDLATAAEINAETRLAAVRESLREITSLVHTDLRLLNMNAPLTPPTPTNINSWTATAINQNLELKAAKLQLDIAKKKIDEYRAARYPSVKLRASYGRYTDGSLYGTQSTDARMAVDFSLPIYGGSFTSSKIRQSLHLRDKVESEIKQLENTIITETRNAYLGVLSAMSTVKAVSRSLDASQKALEATRGGYRVGTHTALNVLDAQEDMFATKRQADHARYNFVMKTLELKMAVGTLSVDDLEVTNNWLAQ